MPSSSLKCALIWTINCVLTLTNKPHLSGIWSHFYIVFSGFPWLLLDWACLVSTLMECFPRRLQDKVAPKNREFRKMLPAAQRSRPCWCHTGTQGGLHPSARRPFPQTQASCEAEFLNLFPKTALMVETANICQQGRQSSPLLP